MTGTGKSVIDVATGDIRFDNGFTVGPTLSRDTFVDSPHFKDATIAFRSDPMCFWNLGTLRLGGERFSVTLQYIGSKLDTVTLALTDGQSGTGGSEGQERQRKAAHDRWLASTLGEQRQFPWGMVWSSFALGPGGSTIGIHYGQPDETAGTKKPGLFARLFGAK